MNEEVSILHETDEEGVHWGSATWSTHLYTSQYYHHDRETSFAPHWDPLGSCLQSYDEFTENAPAIPRSQLSSRTR